MTPEEFAELDSGDLSTLVGVAIAYVGNITKLLAMEWGVEPSEAWAAIMLAREQTDAP